MLNTRMVPTPAFCQPVIETYHTMIAGSCHCPSCERCMANQRCFSTDGEEKGHHSIISHSDMDLAVQAVAEEHTGLTNLPGAQKGGRKLAIVFTCKVCNTRSAKQFTEQAYQHGVVMVRCPGCENYHLIADRLGFFQDESWDIEQAMAALGDTVRAVTNDNVLELTVDDLMGEEKMKEFRDRHGQPQGEQTK